MKTLGKKNSYERGGIISLCETYMPASWHIVHLILP